MFEISISPNENQGRFADLQEIEESCSFVDFRKTEAENAGINVITDGITSRVFESDDFTNVIGATGSRKTMTVVAPTIVSHAHAGHSMIVTDTKCELFKLLHKKLLGLGYKIKVLNLNEPDKGSCYNPLEPIARKYKAGKKGQAMSDAASLAEAIFECVHSEKDLFWENIGKDYFTGLIGTLCEYFPEEDVTMNNVFKLRMQGELPYGTSIYMKKFYEGNENSRLWELMRDGLDTARETKASINSVFSTALNRFVQNDAILRMLSKSDFCMKDLQDEKTVIFILCNEQSLTNYAVLISALIHQWYCELIGIADSGNGILKRKVFFALDEFGNLPPIKGFNSMITLSRARGISFMIVEQSMAQLSYQYGKDVANIILSNSTNKIYLFSTDMELLKHISDSCGSIEDENTHMLRPLITVNQLRHFSKKDGETLMILGRLNPFITYLPNITDYYGVEPYEELNIKPREENENKDIDFKSLVEEKIKKKFMSGIGRPIRRTGKDLVIELDEVIARRNKAKERCKAAWA
ncbi:MAG: type IV secretory system conjugative DNA transfer family protein [Butyrivibrio sp.]|uniref:type IV secretory system conjugative DNA transfer family protein n=1 Tax=Butyrivibrio sp. TaxID=28121 RepID=UPI001B2BE143|nr:type IV secretory system conjugative DNA transfer family protein [Butyrivibrio sp.]MBO6241547.1 type IV secretory system conjugative DNA transfer family protein [Butyrivibrio sp.]